MKESNYVVAELDVAIQLVAVLPLGIQETFFKLSILWYVYKAYVFGGWCIRCLFGKLVIAEVSQSSNLWVKGWTYYNINSGNDD